MTITVDIPEALLGYLSADAGALPRQAVEALAIDAHRQGKLSEAEVGLVLGIRSRFELDQFLKDHGVELAYTWADLEYERRIHGEAGVTDPAPSEARGRISREHGVWVLDAGEPLAAADADEILRQLRAERDAGNFGSGE